MESTIDAILSVRLKSGKRKVDTKYAGKHYFGLETGGKERKWNAMRALRIMKKYIEYTGFDLVYDDLMNLRKKKTVYYYSYVSQYNL